MAGRGPAPADAKRRRNVTQLEDVEQAPFEIPELPKKYRRTVWVKGKETTRQVTYLADTREWWSAWMRSPLSADWAEVHWRALMRVAPIVDDYYRAPTAAKLSAIRVAEASFGGSPYDTKRAGKRVTRPKPKAVGDGAEADAEVTDMSTARRRRLQGGNAGGG